jgi:glycosyltransferase involved in cell wall biosynthesis
LWNNTDLSIGTAEKEDGFAKEVDLVFSVSRYLYDLHKRNNDNTFCVLNGVDFEHYNRAQGVPGVEMRCLGYTGNINQRNDFELILRLSEEFRELQIVLVGPVHSVEEEELNVLKSQGNIVFYGKKTVEELPSFLSRFSVCLMPFITDDWFVRCQQPLKLFEYMSTGKPIVSTYMECLEYLPDGCVYVSRNHEEFIQNIYRALSERDMELARRRMGVAKRHDWSHQFEKINAVMASSIGKMDPWMIGGLNRC